MADIPVYEGLGETLATATTNGQAIFAYTFLAFDETQVRAEFRPLSGPAVPLVLNTNYTVSGLNQPNGGAITLVGVSVAIGDQVYMYRETPIEREKDWQNEGDYKADLVNREQDEIYMIMQELKRGTSSLAIRAALFPTSYTGSKVLPDPSPGLVLGWDEFSQSLINIDVRSQGGLVVGDAGREVLEKETIKEIRDYIGVGEVRDFSTVAEVQVSEISGDIKCIRIAGYYAAGDGGASLYRRATYEPTHAGKLQSSDGAWWVISEATLTPAMFGAIGDGLVDDTSAVQKAHDCASATGAIVKTTDTHLCGPLNIRAPFSGDGKGKLIRLNGIGTWFTLSEGDLSVNGFEIDGNWIAQRGFEVDGVDNTEISGNLVSRIGEMFVHYNGVKSLTVSRNIGISGANGISNIMPVDDPNARPSNSVRVVGNDLEGFAGTAIHFAGKQSASDENFGISNPLVTNLVCIGNTIKNCNGHGIIAQSWHGVIGNNTLENVGNVGGNQGIVCQGRFLTVSGNALNGGLGVGIDMGRCWHSSVVGNQVCKHAEIGIELQSCDTVTCSGNTVVSCGFGITGDGSAGIAVLQGFFGPGWNSSNITVTGNTVSSGDTPGDYGISVGAGCKNNVVSGNSIINSGRLNPKYIAPDAEVLFYGNLEDAGTTNAFVLYGNPVITARSPTGNADIGLQPQGSGRLRIHQSFPSAATPSNFVAQVMIEVKDVSGSSFFIPAKYGSGW